MEAEVIGPILAVREGWAVFRRHAPVLLSGCVVCLSILFACAIIPIPYLNWVLVAAVIFPLLGGLHTLFLRASRGPGAKLSDLFFGFRRFIHWHATGWGLTVVWVLFLIPCLIIANLMLMFALPNDVTPAFSPPWQALELSSVFAASLVAFAIYLRYVFTWLAAAEVSNTSAAVARSQEIIRGRRLRLFLTSATLGLLGPVGLLYAGGVVYILNANAFGRPGWLVYWMAVVCSSPLALASFVSVYNHLAPPSANNQ